jgi:hypothetical protein
MTLWMKGLAIAGLAAGLLQTAPVEAYGWQGHRVVCDLAYRYLSDATRTEVDRLVALDPQFEQFSDVCSWADQVRGSTHRHTSPWHYTNQDPEDPVINEEDCAFNGCITQAITLHAGQFADRSLSDEARLEALKFLAHWLGDIHQPLHVSIAGDLGGNRVDVLWRGERDTNLHRVWDTEILVDHMAETWPDATDDERVEHLIEALAAEIPLAGVDIYTPLDPVAWAQESHDIVRSREFGYYWPETADSMQADDAYYQVGLRINRQRLQQAGVRLAGLLNQLVEERSTAARSSTGTGTGSLN